MLGKTYESQMLPKEACIVSVRSEGLLISRFDVETA